MTLKHLNRRTAIVTGLAALATPSLIRAQEAPETTRRNASAFKTQHWSDHFDSLGKGCIVADISSRALHYWDTNETYILYPSSVPQTEELTKRGYTEVVRKAENPSWTPTASMRERDPDLPERMEGGEAGNPLGTRAMYLGWPAYLIHGTHDTRKIGRRSSSGCIGLYNQHVEALFEKVAVGTQVLLL
ncbi:putative L,D-transpeptidase ErfK/SrfK precursor [Roseovarius albus]|uniref:Putative L,D-transpeptidase ErfK/SrfK n=1 Tax=Roseovarius albus TaxID=1247867 RepID=A0A1X6ZDZ4_9RHOB|nr:L,D-transpeptidase [Roseovarius albus]SLN46953.1 putative L,D-transpeptidase ErfK/SrfK precursor [Roseovarius albus]